MNKPNVKLTGKIQYRAAKAISDAPNLRDRYNAACCMCKYFQKIEGSTEDEGICTLYDFATDKDYVCDSFETMPPPAPVDVPAMVESIAEAVGAEMPDEGMMALKSNALKAISRSDDELRVGNYIVLFGGRDISAFKYVGNKRPLERNADGSHGEFFTAKTILESPHTAIGKFPVGWEHGFEETEISGLEALGLS